MNGIISGKAFVYGSNVDTDQIYPGRFLDLTDPADTARHAMEGVDADFAGSCSPGDIIVADRNFGCGSSREHAVVCLKAAGVGALAAASFGRIFYRNAFNLGLPALICPGIAALVRRGDELLIDLGRSLLRNLSSGEERAFDPVSPYAAEMLRAGGIKPLLKERYGNARPLS
jgi:3-isopropylmalate/(R)-2-methylmalate dehydratase small subunit